MANSGSSVRVRIGRLALNGYTAAEGKRFTGALREHLTNLAQTRDAGGWPKQNGLHLARLDAALPAGARPELAARLVARGLFARLIRRNRGSDDV